MNLVHEIANKIKGSESILIAMHDGYDADCIGSGFALKMALSTMNKNVDIMLQNKVSPMYSKIIGSENVNRISMPNKFYDLLIIVDSSTIDRISINLNQFSKFTIVIDHHQGFDSYGDMYLCEPLSSTGMIIHKLIKELNITIDKYIATCLYLTIVGDTNNFRNNNVNYYTHEITTDLIKSGANMKYVNNIFEKTSLSMIRLLGDVLSDIHYDKKYKICYLMVKNEHIKRTGSSYEEAAKLIEYIRNVEDCDIAFLFLQNKNGVRVKARSKTKNVNEIMKHFNGGGHIFAAGAEIYGSDPYSIINRVLLVTKEYLNE